MEKPKNFFKNFKKLLSELKKYRSRIILSVVFAICASMIFIFSPNELSNMTDEILKGTKVDEKKIEEVNRKIFYNIHYKKEEDIIFEDNLITVEDQKKFKEVLEENLSKEDLNKFKHLIVDENQKVDINILDNVLEKIPENIKNAFKPKMDIEKIKKITIKLLILYFIYGLFSYLEEKKMVNVANLLSQDLRKRLFEKIDKLPLSYFDQKQRGDILSIVANDVDTISQELNHSLSTLIGAITLFIGTLIMMVLSNIYLSLITIFITTLGFFFMFLIMKSSQKYFVKKQEELGKLNGHIEEIYLGLNVVRTYNAKNLEYNKFNKLNEVLQETNFKSQFISGIMRPLMILIGSLGYVLICITGAYLAKLNIITFGVIIAFIAYVRMFTHPLVEIANALTNIQASVAASERVFEFLDAKEMKDEKHFKKILKKEDAVGNIEFKNVDFTYEGNKTKTIKNFSAKIKAGDKLAIVGPTGAGKTTIINLLMKFYEIDKGDILIDDISIKELTRENISELFTMVLQDTWTFSGTIMENIRFNNKEITDKEIKDICKIIDLDHDIESLPNGYNAKLTNVETISSGQKQLLTIARAMVENAPFLILDEATSNVDARTEKLVQKAMKSLMKDKTTFVIAHRLSTIKNSDLILVLKDGDIVEQGKHDELLKNKGAYYNLYNSEFSKV